MKFKLLAKQAWLWAKKFWWAIIIVLLFIGAALASNSFAMCSGTCILDVIL